MFQVVCRSTLVHPHPRQTNSLHTPNGQRFGAAPHSVLSRLVAPTRKSSLMPTRPRRCCPSTWPSELQTKSGLETRLWRGDCTVPQKSTKIRTCARKCGVRGADKVRAVRTERNQVCARRRRGGGSVGKDWARSTHPVHSQAQLRPTTTRTAPSTSVTHLSLNKRAHAAELPTRPTQR